MFLTLLNVNKEVETSTAHFMVEIRQEEGTLAFLNREGCKYTFLRKFFIYSDLENIFKL